MHSTSEDQPTPTRRIVAIALIAFLAIPLPLGIAVWSGVSAFSGKPQGFASDTYYEPWGSLKNGELWFAEVHFSHDIPRRVLECKIKRLNLETGVLRDADVAHARVFLFPFWLGDELYAHGNSALYKMVDQKFVEIALMPPRVPPWFFTRPFLYDGQITTIVNPAQDEFRLVHLIDGQWIDGHKITVPWSNEANETVTAQTFDIQLADEERFTASALVPENSEKTVSSRQPIQPTEMQSRTSHMAHDRDGLLDVSVNFPIRVLRQAADGQWKKLESPFDIENHHWNHPFLLADPAEEKTYLIDIQSMGAYVDVYRIEGNTVQPSHLHWRGNIPEYFGRWQRFFVGLLMAWLLHIAVLMFSVRMLEQRRTDVRYQFGILQATPAFVWRRGFAVATDLIVAAAILCVLVLAQLPVFGIQRRPVIESVVFDVLSDLENMIPDAFERGINLQVFSRMSGGIQIVIVTIIEALFDPPLLKTPLFCLIVIGELLSLAIAKVYVEGRFGLTIGKWLFCIRIIRSTLQPCGFARSLVRNVLYWVDLPFLITPFPAAISMMLPQYGQRIGDRVADTIVVNAGSICERECRDPK